MPEQRKTPFAAIMIALVAAAALLFTLVDGGGSADGGSPAVVTEGDSGNSAFLELPRRDPDDPLAIGDVDAPVW